MTGKVTNNIKRLWLAIIWLVVCFLLQREFNDSSYLTHHIFTACTLVSYVMCIINWVTCSNRLISLYVLFVIYVLLSNLGESILCMFGFPEELLFVYAKSTIEQINGMLRFQLLCAAALNVGTMLYIYKADHCVNIQTQRDAFNNSQPLPRTQMTVLDILLFLSMAFVILFSIRMFFYRQEVDYETLYYTKQEWSTFIGQIFNFLSVLLCFWFLFNKKYVRTIYAFLLWCVFIYMLIGVRSMSVGYLCILLVMFPLDHPGFFRKRFAVLWIALAFVGFAALSIISDYRTVAIGSNAFVAADISIWDSALATVSEMGMSANTTVMAMDEVNHGFPLHQTILAAVLNSFIPFISDLPAIQEEAIQLSQWVTDLAKSYNSGFGFSCIAEAYVNYGGVGWLFFIVYGFFIAYAENTAYRRIMRGRFPYALFLLAFLAQQIFFARGEIGTSTGTVRLCVYAAIIICIWQIARGKKVAL